MTKKQPAKRGPKTKWKDEFVEQAGKLALLGLIDVELAKFFGVAHSTWDNWKRDKPELMGALKGAKEIADADVVKSLYNRACGYTCKEEKAFVIDGKIETEEIEKIYPPDPTSMIFWLKNRQAKLFRDKPDISDSEEQAQPIIVKIVREDASKKKEPK